LAGHLVGAAYNLVRMAKLMEQAKEPPVVQVAWLALGYLRPADPKGRIQVATGAKRPFQTRYFFPEDQNGGDLMA
jgi:hypothetical protein